MNMVTGLLYFNDKFIYCLNMRLFWVLTIFLFAFSCAGGTGKSVNLAPYNTKSDVDLFLSTRSHEIEAQVLDRLRVNNVSHDDLKSILREYSKNRMGPTGLFLNLELENGRHPYSLYVPDQLQPDKSYPMIVILHGLGGSGDTTIESWVKRLGSEFIIVCPSYPMGAWWTMAAENMVLGLIRSVEAQYPVDYNRVFLAGMSNGAIGAYMIGMFYPDYFAGIVPIAGAITERYMHFLVNLNNTPIYMIQGKNDPIFPIQFSRRINKILSDMKYPVTYREHEESGTAHGGHFLPDGEIPALRDWLLAQKRRVDPSVLRMTREENHMGRIQWARLSKGHKLSALQIPGPGEESVNMHDGKIASLFATRKDMNEFEIVGQNLLEYELYLNSDMLNFDEPVRVYTQKLYNKNNVLKAGEKEMGFYDKIKKDRAVLLREYKARRDPWLLYDAKITIQAENETEIAFNR